MLYQITKYKTSWTGLTRGPENVLDSERQIRYSAKPSHMLRWQVESAGDYHSPLLKLIVSDKVGAIHLPDYQLQWSQNKMNKLAAFLCLVFWSVSLQAHEVTVDTPFTPQEEIAGVDTPPYKLEALFSGPVGVQLARAGCSQSMLVKTAIGEWLELDNDGRSRFVNCVSLVLYGPSRLSGIIETGRDLPEVSDAVVAAIGVLAEIYRPPYNLSAVEVVSGTLVVLGMALPVNHRSLMRSIAE